MIKTPRNFIDLCFRNLSNHCVNIRGGILTSPALSLRKVKYALQETRYRLKIRSTTLLHTPISPSVTVSSTSDSHGQALNSCRPITSTMSSSSSSSFCKAMSSSCRNTMTNEYTKRELFTSHTADKWTSALTLRQKSTSLYRQGKIKYFYVTLISQVQFK